MSHRQKNRQMQITEAVIKTQGERWSESTRATARSDVQRVLEALVAEYDVDLIVEAMNKQGFKGDAYRYLIQPLRQEALSRRSAAP